MENSNLKELKESVITKIKEVLEKNEEQESVVLLSKEEYELLNKILDEKLKIGEYYKDKYRREYGDESYYYDLTPEEQAEMDEQNGNDYSSVKIGDDLFFNVDYDRYSKYAVISVDTIMLNGDEAHKYGVPEMKQTVSPEELIAKIVSEEKESDEISNEELQKIIDENDENQNYKEEEVKQALIKRILEQQQIIEKQKEEIANLSQKGME